MRRAVRTLEIALNMLVMAALIALLVYVLGVQALSGKASQDNIWICICLACGAMLMMAVYNSSLRLFTRRERAAQFFSLFCVGQSLRFFFMDGSIGPSLFPNAPGVLVLFGLRYIPFCLGIIGLQMFIYEVYGAGRSVKVKRALILALILVNLVIPALGLDHTVWRAILGAPVGAVFILNCIVVIVRSPEFKANRLTILYLFGFVLYAISFSFTAAMYNASPYISVMFNFVFAVIHCVILASRFAESLAAVERANLMLEDKVRERTRELVLANDSLQASERGVRELVRNISHDLKTPMTVLNVNLEMLSEREAPPEMRRRLNIAYAKSQDLARLIRTLLAVGRTESGTQPPNMHWVPLSHLLNELSVKYAEQMDSQGLSFHISYHEDCLLHVEEDRFWRAVDNLLSNAQRYTKPGGSICVAADSVEQGFCAIRVSDTGSGIAAHHLPRIFEPYYKADPARGAEGTGLGLHITKTVVELMGGSVWAESAPGVGTSIFFTLRAERLP